MRSELEDRVRALVDRAGLGARPRAVVAAGAALALVAVGVVVFWYGTSGTDDAMPESIVEPSAAVETSSAAAASAPGSADAANVASAALVHVVGAVPRPGVYSVALGGRVDDALRAAGGPLGDAELSAVNLARTVSDGEQIVVPKRGEAPVLAAPASGAAARSAGTPGSAASAGGGAGAGGVVDLNTASESELDALPGVGPATAKRIVEDRARNGPFRKAEDLMRVPGIGPKKFDALKDLVRA